MDVMDAAVMKVYTVRIFLNYKDWVELDKIQAGKEMIEIILQL